MGLWSANVSARAWENPSRDVIWSCFMCGRAAGSRIGVIYFLIGNATASDEFFFYSAHMPMIHAFFLVINQLERSELLNSSLFIMSSGGFISRSHIHPQISHSSIHPSSASTHSFIYCPILLPHHWHTRLLVYPYLWWAIPFLFIVKRHT